MTEKIRNFIKKEIVFCISFIAAVISAFFVKPSAEYIGYINFSVLALLFCLMAAIEGLKQSGVFSLTASWLVNSANGMRKLYIILITLCFFSSMFITNDVALIAFVPLTIILMKEYKSDLIKTIAGETIAANLGSMLTPLGNPQNLFIYENSGMNLLEFTIIMLPLSAISYILLLISSLMISKQALQPNSEHISFDKKSSAVYGILFLICLLTVLHIVPYGICTAIILITLLIYNRKVLANVDYILLLTFVCFFIFSGNLAAIPQAEKIISAILENNTLAASFLISQIISNVPCTILLYPFCNDIKALMFGVGVGGLGTPVASLASLISYKIYANSDEAKGGKYLLVFMGMCIAFLIILLPSAYFLLK